MKRARVFGLFLLLVLVGLARESSANPFYNIPNPAWIFKDLAMNAANLYYVQNLINGDDYSVHRTVVTTVQQQGGWPAGLIQNILVNDTRYPDAYPDYAVRKTINEFRKQARRLERIWLTAPVASPQFQQQFIVTDYAYYNAMAATYFYIEALRRTYIINNAVVTPCPERAQLIQHLRVMENIAWRVREAMRTIRDIRLLRLPLRSYCVEATFRDYRIDVTSPQPLNFIPYPYRYDNQFWTVPGIRPIAPVPTLPPYSVPGAVGVGVGPTGPAGVGVAAPGMGVPGVAGVPAGIGAGAPGIGMPGMAGGAVNPGLAPGQGFAPGQGYPGQGYPPGQGFAPGQTFAPGQGTTNPAWVPGQTNGAFQPGQTNGAGAGGPYPMAPSGNEVVPQNDFNYNN